MKKKKNVKKNPVGKKETKKPRKASETKKKVSSSSSSKKESGTKVSASKSANLKKSEKVSASKSASVKKSEKVSAKKPGKAVSSKKATAKKAQPVKKPVQKPKKKEKDVKKSAAKKTKAPDKSPAKAQSAPLSRLIPSSKLKKKPPVKRKVKHRKILELKKELEYLNKRDQKEVLIKDAEGRSYCQDEHCDQPAVTDIYCRYHYLALWKYLQTKKQFSENKYLFHTINNIVNSLGEEALQFILRDLKNEKSFEVVAKEMSFSIKEEGQQNIESESGF